MSYIPPVETNYSDTIIKEIVKENEERIYQAIIKQSIKVDKYELIKALQYDRNQYEKGYQDGLDDAVKHGFWKQKKLDTFRKYSVECSCCGSEYIGNYDAYHDPDEFIFCPNCGARMDGE